MAKKKSKAKSKKAKVKKSKAKAKPATKKTAKRAAAKAKPAKAKKSKAPVKKTVKAKAKKPVKAAKKTVKRPVKKKKQMIEGEGSYEATRAFDKDQTDFVKRNKDKIPAMGKAAEEALDGPEGDSLREAEAEAADRSRDTFDS